MEEAKKEMKLEKDEILRVSVRKKHPCSKEEYDYEMCFIADDKDAVQLSEIFEKTLEKEIDIPFLIKVLERAIEEGVDISDIPNS